MTRVVSVTQNAIERDSRAYKVAASLTRFGYESIVIETERSSLDRAALPFELLTLGERTPAKPPSSSAAPEPTVVPAPEPRPSLPLRLAMRLFAFLPERVRDNLRPRLADVLDRAVGLLEPVYVAISVGRNNLHILRAMPRADVYYMHYFGHYPAAYLLAKRHRARLVYDAHDANFDPDPALLASFRNPGTMRLLESIERRFSRGAARFMTVSDGVADLLERRFGRRPAVIRNCPDLRLDRPAEPTCAPPPASRATPSCWSCRATRSPGHGRGGAAGADRRCPSACTSPSSATAMSAFRSCSPRTRLQRPGPPAPARAPDRGRELHRRQPTPHPILYYAITTATSCTPSRTASSTPSPPGCPILYPPLAEIAALCERYGLGLPIDPRRPGLDRRRRRAAAARTPSCAAALRANVGRAREELSWEHEERVLARSSSGGTLASGRRAEVCGIAGAVRGAASTPRCCPRWPTRSPPRSRRPRLPVVAAGRRAADARARWTGPLAARPRSAWPTTASRSSTCARSTTSRCVSDDGSLALAFNGEVYNYVELRSELESARPRVPDQRRHRGAARRLRGVGTGLRRALRRACGPSRCSTPRTARLLLSRDRFGIKPLYYALTGGRPLLRLGDQGPAAASRASGPSPTRRRSAATC